MGFDYLFQFKFGDYRVNLFDPISKKHVTHYTDGHVPDLCGTVAIDRENVILCGGIRSGASNVTWMFNMTETTIKRERKSSMNKPRSQFGITYDKIGKYVYVFGGASYGTTCLCSEQSRAEGGKM